MGSKRITLKGSLGGSKSSLTETAPIAHLERNVRFSLRNCNIGDFCVRKLDDNEIKKFYKRLGYFEDHTWRDVKQIPREDGFSIENKDSSNFTDFCTQHPEFSTFLHFRVNGTSRPFRVFGALKEDLCYILSIDNAGKINHK